jgi:hypothetical protein
MEFCEQQNPSNACGISRHPDTNDFPTYVVNLPTLAYVSVVIQMGTVAEWEMFESDTTADDERLEVLMTCLTRAIDRPMFLSLPTTVTTVRPMAPMLLAAKADTGTKMLGLCITLTDQHPLDIDLASKALHPSWHAMVQRVVVRGVLCKPISWKESLQHPREADAIYNINENTRADLAACIDLLWSMVNRGIDDDSGAIQCFTTRTSCAAYTAYCPEYRKSIVELWLKTAHLMTIYPMRIVLLTRLLEWMGPHSKQPDFPVILRMMLKGLRKSAYARASAFIALSRQCTQFASSGCFHDCSDNHRRHIVCEWRDKA